MSTIEIKITTNGLETSQAAALSNFLTSLHIVAPTEKKDVEFIPGTETPVSFGKFELAEPTSKTEEAPKPTRSRAKKEKVAEATPEPEAVEPTEEPAQEEELPKEDPTEKITLHQIRSIVQEKAKDHKDALRGELKKFGVANVSTLEEKNWVAFYEFAKAL